MKTEEEILKEIKGIPREGTIHPSSSMLCVTALEAMKRCSAQKDVLIEAQEELIKLYGKWWDDDLWHDDEGIPMDERRKFIQICRRIKELKKEE